MFIRGETLSAHSARPRELRIPKWIVLVRENVTVNKRAYRKKQLKLYSEGFCLFSFSSFTFGFHGFDLKELKIIQCGFRTGARTKI